MLRQAVANSNLEEEEEEEGGSSKRRRRHVNRPSRYLSTSEDGGTCKQSSLKQKKTKSAQSSTVPTAPVVTAVSATVVKPTSALTPKPLESSSSAVAKGTPIPDMTPIKSIKGIKTNRNTLFSSLNKVLTTSCDARDTVSERHSSDCDPMPNLNGDGPSSVRSEQSYDEGVLMEPLGSPDSAPLVLSLGSDGTLVVDTNPLPVGSTEVNVGHGGGDDSSGDIQDTNNHGAGQKSVPPATRHEEQPQSSNSTLPAGATAQPCNCMYKVLVKLNHISLTQRNHTRMLERLMAHNGLVAEQATPAPPGWPKKLPIKDVQLFLEFDRLLTNADNYAYAMNYLEKNASCRDPKENTREALKAFISNSLKNHLNWKGTTLKFGIGKKKIGELVIEAVRKTHKDFAKKKIITEASRWLRNNIPKEQETSEDDSSEAEGSNSEEEGEEMEMD
ncbi:uncharacterized protein LOC113209976 [Frankliniella occidentalis]|uniref:Uncharacterized protein LOC113209976 n=1 Tax=Frankliniella occidentalis TaxID=133901 RepID=A0A6J1SRM5_FRAOC|nr:uncharacterized protein LOC113209976 [Frankliniella occidentalis]